MATPRAVKRLLDRVWVRALLGALAAAYIRLVWATGRWRIEGAEIPRALWAAKRPFILGFWHGRLLMLPYSWNPDIPGAMLISEHRDGRLIAAVIRHFGFGSLAGSTRHGGAGALRDAVRRMKAGDCIGITPDGPRGPRMRAGAGIVQLARLAGAPVVPVTFSASRRRVLKTWDSFVLALPFARGTILWGEAIEVPDAADENAIEAARARIEDALNALTEEADRRCGHAPLAPAAAESAARNGLGSGAEARP